MDYFYFLRWTEFAENVIGHLAWPLVVLLGIYAFRDPLVGAIKNVKTFKHGDTELTFEREAEELLDNAREFGTTVVGYPDLPTPADLAKLSSSEIRGRIISEWIGIEAVIKAWAAENSEGPAIASMPIISLIDQMLARGIIDSRLAQLLRKYKELRNQAAHDTDISLNEHEVVELLGLTKSIKTRLENFIAVSKRR